MALQQLSVFPSGPFLWKKNLIIIIHLSKEYSSHSAVSAFLMVVTEVLEEDSSEPTVRSE